MFLVSADDEAVLVAVAAKGAKVGMMLFEVKRTAAAVAEVLRADVTVPEVVVPDVPAQPVVEPVLTAVPPLPVEPVAYAAAPDAAPAWQGYATPTPVDNPHWS